MSLVVVARLRFGLVSLLAAGWLSAAVATEPPAPKRVQQHGKASLWVVAPPSVQASGEGCELDIRLSDEVTVIVRVEGKASLKVELLDQVKGTEFLALAAQSPPAIRTVGGGAAMWEQEFLLTPLQPGKHPLTLPSLHYSGDDGKWKPVNWAEVTVCVYTRIKTAEPSAARDITAIEELPTIESGRGWLLWAALGLGTVVLAGLAFVVGRRRSVRRPPLPPDQWALRELEKLATQEPATAQEVEKYHTALSGVVRHYLEKRFQIPAERQTTAEFLAAVRKSSPLTEAQQALLGELLTRCDLAKFARVWSAVAECRGLVEQARNFVLETTPKQPS
jgi:hypothetical protein